MKSDCTSGQSILFTTSGSLSTFHTEAWLNNVYPPSMDQSEIGIYAIIHGRLFLNELHEVCNRWGNLGQQFLNDLFYWVWNKLDMKTTRERAIILIANGTLLGTFIFLFKFYGLTTKPPNLITNGSRM